jgi:hypothetical protein
MDLHGRNLLQESDLTAPEVGDQLDLSERKRVV